VELRPSEAWVFGHRHAAQDHLHRLAMFLVMNNVSFGLRAPMIVILTATLGFHYLVSNLISLVVLFVLRYAVADHIIWAPAQRPSDTELTGSVTTRNHPMVPVSNRRS
jgi:putative flippase GtrA